MCSSEINKRVYSCRPVFWAKLFPCTHMDRINSLREQKERAIFQQQDFVELLFGEFYGMFVDCRGDKFGCQISHTDKSLTEPGWESDKTMSLVSKSIQSFTQQNRTERAGPAEFLHGSWDRMDRQMCKPLSSCVQAIMGGFCQDKLAHNGKRVFSCNVCECEQTTQKIENYCDTRAAKLYERRKSD